MTSSNASLKVLKAPVSDDSLLTTREKIILLQSSKLHGCVFPPWKGTPSSEEFESDYLDKTEFDFSEDQREVFDGWKKPNQEARRTVKDKSQKLDLVQDITTDCSVVASLCAESARAERLGHDQPSIMATAMYPQGSVSRNGKYVFKFHFNGCFRRVEIDDRLPSSKTSRALHVFDRGDSNIIWPAIVEKAYLKVRGGYDFPGSNSGTDLFVLTGWIPEQLFLQRFV